MTLESEALLRTFLTGRDFDCPVCGYNLRDLQNDLCPECGTTLRLQVGALEPSQTACIVGLVGLAAGAGFSGLLASYFLVMVLFFARYHEISKLLATTAIPFLILGTALLIWLRSWRRLRRLDRPLQRSLAAGCWALAIADLIIFAISID